jgi:multicomponent Na+:H+ antiporter subunit C
MFGEDGLLHELLVERFNYCIYVVLLLIGLYAMIGKNNLIKKLIGMSIFQTAIILFYVSVGVKEGATIPIYKPEHDPHGHHAEHLEHPQPADANASGAPDDNATTAVATHSSGNEDHHGHGPTALTGEETTQYANPIPHVLMLTAIVVGVATLGVALALTQRIYRAYGTIEEDELMLRLEEEALGVTTAKDSAKPKSKPKRGRAKSRKGKKA